MKLLFFHYSMQAGGAERTIALLSDYAARQGDNVTIVTMDAEPSFYKLHPNISHICLKIGHQSENAMQGIANNGKALKAVKAAYRACNPDVVVCFGSNSILLSFLARGKMKYKIIGSERTNPYLSTRGFWNKSKKWISVFCDGFLFQTQGARNYYPAITKKKSIVLHNSLLSADFDSLNYPWEERSNICAVGRMDADKCFDDLLNAFAKVHRKYPKTQLDIYGDGPLRNELEALSVTLGLQTSVVFHGRSQTILQEYAGHKLFAMTSRLEGMPNVLVEALASGCACVAANCNFGPSELICDGENGFLVPVHDTDAMADRICRLLQDDTLCREFSQQAITIRKTHNIETIGKIFRDYIDK
ncbi:MAG: glycosyltransferase family 4 protein [Christensenella sp.]